ncbi:hypothetical protein ACFZAD_35005 [Streptomyces iakyrus]|uniref:hypothetical protein n=1 Tax=Streptomyces iakyrus TaxID=68219 RepID=UPI0036EB51C2
MLHRLRFFSLIGPCRPHPEQRPGGAARAKQVAHTGPAEVLERMGRVRPQEIQAAALRRRWHEPHTG